MHPAPLSGRELRALLCRTASGPLSRQELNALLGICHALATTFLRGRIAHATLAHRMQHASYSDLAFDCIADLFQRDEPGTLPWLKAYVDGLPLASIPDEELILHLRRLIFSRVNQSLFRIYGELDPSLGKILRNIKLALRATQNVAHVERFGEPCIVPHRCETLEHLASYDRDELYRELTLQCGGSERTPELLTALISLLRQQTDHSRIVPLMTVALAFRSLYGKPAPSVMEEPAVEATLLMHDTGTTISGVCQEMRRDTIEQYVGSGKISAQLFDRYFAAIELYLHRKFTGADGNMFSLYEAVCTTVPGLTKEEYLLTNRSHAEYLCRLTHRLAVRRLRSGLGALE